MAKPFRNVRSASSATYARTFFVTTKTSMGRALLQSDRNAMLLVDVLRTCIAAGRFQVRDFVIMPNHVHLLITVQGDTPIEKAMQFIKGGFSFRLKKETGYAGEVWQRGYSEMRANSDSDIARYRDYIARNPVRAGLAAAPDTFRWCFEFLKRQKAAGAKAPICPRHLARLKSCPDTKPVLLHYDGQRPRGIAVARNVRRRPVLPAHARGMHPSPESFQPRAASFASGLPAYN